MERVNHGYIFHYRITAIVGDADTFSLLGKGDF